MRKLFLFICCVAFLKAHGQLLIRGPYLTKATSHSIVVQWQTDIATTSKIRFGISPANLNNTFTNIAYSIDHKIELTGLQPETMYYYSIETATLSLLQGSDLYFKTLPIADAAYSKPIRFWAVGDMGKQTQQQIQVRESFKQYVDTNYVDGWIMLGDNAYETGSQTDYQAGFFNYYQNDITRHIVLWPALGNHDYANDLTFRENHQIPYFDIFDLPQHGECGGVASNTEQYYSVDYGNVHLVNLDSYGLELVNGNYYGLADTAFSPQVQWLRNDLLQNQLPWVIVSFHHPPYTMGTHNSDAELDLAAIRTNLIPILERYNVDLVLNGHSHTYERSRLMKGHVGLESSFDSVHHNLQFGSASYDGSNNSCPYVKNATSATVADSGSLYAVVGSGSAIPQSPQLTWPHDAMYYSNFVDNGSLVLLVEGNKLEGTWISNDMNQVVKDKFYIFKQVNQLHELYVNFPATISLKASWKADKYVWSHGDSTQTCSILFYSDSMVIVTDMYSCLADTFLIKDSSVLTSIQYVEQKFQCKVIPNPLTSTSWLELPGSGQYQLNLINPLGKLVWHEKIQVEQPKYQLPLKDKLPQGVYYLRIVNTKSQAYTVKIVL